MADQPFENASVAFAAVQDPATSGETLSVIAQHHPHLHQTIAAHPNSYPGLVEWMRVNGPALQATTAVLPTVAADPGTVGQPLGYVEAQPAAAPNQPREPRRVPLLYVVLGGITTIAVLAAVWALFLRDAGDSSAATPPPATDVATSQPVATDAADATAVPAPATLEPTTAPAPEPTPTPTPTPTPEPTPTPTFETRSVHDEVWCGLSGTVLAVGETDRFYAVICDDDGLTYIGTGKASGSEIRLPAQGYGGSYSAANGATTYSLSPSRLVVTDPSGTIVDEVVTSWQTW